MKKLQQKIKGFSLLEAMLSVFLVSFGIVAILPLLSTSLRETFDSRDQMIATLLAQEGIEIMRNIRDNHWAGDNPGFPSSFDHGSIGRLNYDSTILNPSVCGGSSCQLRRNGDFYDHSGGIQTKFYRKVEVSDTASGKNLTSMVIWKGSTFPDVSACNTQAGCVWAEVELTGWGG